LIFINSPDPINEKTQKWYDTEFYNLIKKVMKKNGLTAQHITSPFFTPQSLGIIESRINSVFKDSIKIRTNIPSMGEWCFCFFQDHKIDSDIFLNLQVQGLKFLNKQSLSASLHFPKDKIEQIFKGNRGYKDELQKVFFKEWQEYVKMSDFD
jgi:predicted membrane-bound spermidine synthase